MAEDTQTPESDKALEESGSEVDEIDVLMLQERLGLQVEKQLEDMEAKGLDLEGLKRLLEVEADRCRNDAGIQVSPRKCLGLSEVVQDEALPWCTFVNDAGP
jgi:hypothetical protein